MACTSPNGKVLQDSQRACRLRLRCALKEEGWGGDHHPQATHPCTHWLLSPPWAKMALPRGYSCSIHLEESVLWSQEPSQQ